jgi:hypothetical protein
MDFVKIYLGKMNNRKELIIQLFKELFYQNSKFEVCRFENGEITRLRLMGKRKIAILNIDSILNKIFVG